MIKLVVFDWNGTLLADMQAVLVSANAAEIPLFGLKPLTLKKLRDVHEVPLMHAYEKLGISNSTFRAKSDAINEAFHKVYEPLIAHSRTRPGTKSALSGLTRRGKHCIILSNHSAAGICPHLNRLRIKGYFDEVLANDRLGVSHFDGKQHRLEKYLSENNFNPSEVVIVGDTPEEVRIGRSLGVHTVSVAGGMCSRARLVAAQPDKLINSVYQIVTTVEELA